MALRPAWMALRPSWLALRPIWLALRPNWMALGPSGGTDEWTDKRTDGKSPYFTGLCPLSGPLPKKNENQSVVSGSMGNLGCSGAAAPKGYKVL